MTDYTDPIYTPPFYANFPFIEIGLLLLLVYVIVRQYRLLEKLTGDPPAPPSKKSAP